MPSVSPGAQVEGDAVDRLQRQIARRRNMPPTGIGKCTFRSRTLQDRRAHARRLQMAGLRDGPGRTTTSTRPLAAAALEDVGAAVGEDAARRQRLQVRRLAGDGRELVATVVVEPRHRAQQAQGVGVLRAARTARRRGAVSTMRPAYITITRSHRPATTPRSWVIRTIAMPSSRLQPAEQLQDLRLHRDVERGRRLVGDQQVGLAQQRHRDHHPLAHAAGELVRVHVEAALRPRGCRRGRAWRCRASGPRPRRCPCARAAPRSSAARSSGTG